ncbi:MAG: hypothetical protein LYZ69_05495 [Nitrososphaerales archaeon]|nr:hypothetical protein [Nitrososphaerales archaeon]
MQVPRTSEADSETISLSRVKDAARRLLPPGSTARSVILAEKDVLPASEALAKFEVFDRLLRSELGP